MTYKQTCQQFIIDNLPDLIGEEIEVSGIGMRLTESENSYGSWYCSTYKAEQDLDNFGRGVVADFINDYKFEFGNSPEWDAYTQPEQFHCLMMIMGVESEFNSLDIVQDNWDKCMVISKKFIDSVIEELE